MAGYYAERLSAERLRKCYEIAPPRVRQYLDAELDYVLQRIRPDDVVLELGCGYGRIFERLACNAGMVVGIDNAYTSLALGRHLLEGFPNCHFVQMDAATLAFKNHVFDVVVCIQNGISAFKVDQRKLVEESTRVTRKGGRVLMSTYSLRFWDDRLEWFRLQAEHGLLGKIDEEATGDGVIICRDGFKATTVTPDEFLALTSNLDVHPLIEEVDESSLFCDITL